MHRLLHIPPKDADAPGEKMPENQGSSTSALVALDVLLRLAPIGIMVIDHRYQIFSLSIERHTSY